MYIVMITGSPHKHVTSAQLADAFILGAMENGHTVFRFDTLLNVSILALVAKPVKWVRNPVYFKTA